MVEADVHKVRTFIRKEAVVRLPINTQNMQFIVATLPEAVIDFESKQPRIDSDGQPISAVGLIALGADGAEILSVKVAGQPKGLTQGSLVKVTGLLATTWQMGDRHGVSFRAEGIEPLNPPRTASAA
ncbi:hypothetical protein AXFE_31450 [Acidithrix ferrooxidans]|uniref:Regulatory protein n=1 Tax=Acidithrix ferrooxidans TaxID=1280514 RepID=A0A0D8HDI6_9ACTN|nr:hypothetical protein AXFE_31450 [Acidithrix ferrooxidans]